MAISNEYLRARFTHTNHLNEKETRANAIARNADGVTWQTLGCLRSNAASLTDKAHPKGEILKIFAHSINETLLGFGLLINDLAPESADKTASLRCANLARHFFVKWAESIVEEADPERIEHLWANGRAELDKAIYQAQDAIRLDGK